ncbi:hypothetical protein BJP36_43965 [Moorena producens JHB]|uniref:Uncharacterized protein n=1 Tax=Moorena producens (strain JHB) TaxID=1454205 RepID=A0A9Q9STG5_MOOP1|nr:hypothetical protein [Moorena producens]WAN69317.1 hypothetical protein BJP36_43965 [Moorena producens JHB]
MVQYRKYSDFYPNEVNKIFPCSQIRCSLLRSPCSLLPKTKVPDRVLLLV